MRSIFRDCCWPVSLHFFPAAQAFFLQELPSPARFPWPEDSRAEKYLNIIGNEGLRLAKMLTEILSLTRIDSGKATLQFRLIDIGVLLKDISGTLPLLLILRM